MTFQLRLSFENPKSAVGSISLKLIEFLGKKETVTFMFSCPKLEKKTIFSGKPDTYFTISVKDEADRELKLYESEVVSKSFSPSWKELTLYVSDFVNGPKDEKEIYIDVYEVPKSGKPNSSPNEPLGNLKTTFGALTIFKGVELDIIDTKKSKTVGIFKLDNYQLGRKG